MAESPQSYSEGWGGQLYLGMKEKEKNGTQAEYYTALNKNRNVPQVHHILLKVFKKTFPVDHGLNAASGIQISRPADTKVVKQAILL